MTQPKPPIEWNVLVARLTVFPESLTDNSHADWWKVVTGSEPENEQRRPREGIAEYTGTARIGDSRDVSLILGTRLDRTDWVIRALDRVDATTGAPELLGAVSTVLPEFTSLLTPWLTTKSPPALRVALGVQLTAIVDTPERGYELLLPYLPLKVEPTGISDLLFRINRPRRSKSLEDDTMINRLSTWSVGKFSTFVVPISGGGTPRPGSSVFGCRLELDISTEQGRTTPLPTAEISGLLNELATLSLEIAEEGDKP